MMKHLHVLLELNIVPIGSGVSISKYVAECHRIFEERGLKVQLHAFGTNVEGRWEDVLDAVRACHEELHDVGVRRLLSDIKISTRVDRDQGLAEKVRAVESHRTVERHAPKRGNDSTDL